MSKPTLFFSHSSKDKEMIAAIKDKITKYTGNTLDIFVSSDGQSIPFGRNWIHKIEEGLDNAKIMFVFVTENSISTGWIYFEAGFAYSRGIQVIPVGIGIDIGSLKSPLNLLQGFNITSFESFNNLISIINGTFDYSFSDGFTEKDYTEIMELSGLSAFPAHIFDDSVCSIKSEIHSEYKISASEVGKYDIKAYFDRIKQFLEENQIPYAFKGNSEKCAEISVKGISISLAHEANPKLIDSTKETLRIRISPYNFSDSFSLYLSLLALFEDKRQFYIHIRLNKPYSFVGEDVDTAALLSACSDWFSLSGRGIGCFECQKLNLGFQIFDDRTLSSDPHDYLLNVVFDCTKIVPKAIVDLVSKLYSLGVIYGG